MENDTQTAELEASEANKKRLLLEQQLEEVRDSLSSAQSQLCVLNAERDGLKERLDSLNSELDQERDSNQRLTREKGKLEAELSELVFTIINLFCLELFYYSYTFLFFYF
jgi:chromosome segregation ATPase